MKFAGTISRIRPARFRFGLALMLFAVTCVAAVCAIWGNRLAHDRLFSEIASVVNANRGAVLDGKWGDAELSLDLPHQEELDANLALIEKVGPIRRLRVSSELLQDSSMARRIVALNGLESIELVGNEKSDNLDPLVQIISEASRSTKDLSILRGTVHTSPQRLSVLPQLKSLSLDGCNPTSDRLLLAGGFPALDQLTLRPLPWGEIEIDSLARLASIHIAALETPSELSNISIRKLGELKTLKLLIEPPQKCVITLEDCPNLSEVELRRIEFDKRLFAQLTKNSTALRRLSVTDISSSGFATAEAAEMFSGMEKLRSLDLTVCSIRRGVLRAIAGMSSLQELIIEAIYVLDEDMPRQPYHKQGVGAQRAKEEVRALEELAQCRELTSLAISVSIVTGRDLEWIKRLRSLKRLDLRRCAGFTITSDPLGKQFSFLNEMNWLNELWLSGEPDPELDSNLRTTKVIYTKPSAPGGPVWRN